MKKQQSPSLRFKGFSGAWEEKKIGEIFSVTSGTTPLRSNQNYFNNGSINWVKTTDLNNSILEKTEEKIAKLALTETSLKILPKDTLFVAMYGGFNQIGRTGLLGMEATCNQALAAILPDKSQNPFYLLTYLNYSVEYWKSIAASSRKDPNITKQDVLDFECFFPTLPEQTQIGNFFRHLDQLIAECRVTLEKSRQLKKAMLAKMFPAHGETMPKIRFKGFTGDWERKKLGEVVEIIGGGTPDTTISEYWNGDIDWYSPSEIGDKVFANESVRKITKLGLQKSSATILPANKTILFTSRASIGDMAILTKEGTTNQGFQSFIVGEELDVYFLYSMGFQIKDYALKKASGSTFLEISKNLLSQMEFLIPSTKEEQTQIGNFFRQLDKTIALQSAELSKLNQLKKGLLSAMLV